MRRAVAKVFLTIFLLGTAATALSACNTMEGAGQDMQSGGRALSNSAERNK